MAGHTHLDLNLDIEQRPWTDMLDRGVIDGELTRMGVLRAGTNAGLPSIAMVVELPDGNAVMVQTTWRILHAAVRACEARWGAPA
jgi:hypothetical protein